MKFTDNVYIQLELLKHENLKLKQELKILNEKQLQSQDADNRYSDELTQGERLNDSLQMYRLMVGIAGEGICVIEMKIEPGEPLDYRFIEINESFEKQSKLVNAKGKWMRELRPDHEEWWFEIYRDVALTGKPLRFEHCGMELDNRWFTVFAFRVGSPNQKRVAIVLNDITSQKTSELKLRLSEERLRTLVTASSEVLYRMNSNWSEMYQLHCHGFLSNTQKPNKNWFSEYIPIDDQVLVSNAINKAIETKSVFELEHRVTKADGTFGWTFSRAVPLLDNNGNIQEWFGAATDITETKQSIEALKRSETLLKQAGMLANFGAWELEFLQTEDVNANPLRWSDQVYRIFGYTPGSVTVNNQFFFDRIYPEDKERIIQAVAQAVSDKKPYFIEHPIITADNVERIVVEHAEIIFDVHGKPIRMIGAIQDITDHKLAQETIRINEVKFRRLFETMTQGVVYFNFERNVISANQASQKILGKTLEQLVDETFDGSFLQAFNEDLTEITYETHPVNIAFRTGLPVYDVIIGMYNTNQHHLKWLLMSAVPHCNEILANTTVFLTFTDITERKNTELALSKKNTELKMANAKAEESDNLKSTFIANLSHEVRTPMNGILGFADLLRNPKLSQETQNFYIENITICGKRMLDIIYDLVDISLLQTGQTRIKPEIIDVSKKLEKLYTMFHPEANKKGLVLESDNELPPDRMMIKTDRAKLLQVLSNLIKNALKFTREGSIKFGSKIEGDNFLFYVKDTGFGINEEQQAIIFDSFRQEQPAVSGIYEGVGLGLAICKSYVELMGGIIYVESTPMKGSTFSFTIPYNHKDYKYEGNMDGLRVSKIQSDTYTKKEINCTTVLVVEDEEVIYIYLQELLKMYDIKTVYARDGLEAVEAVKSNNLIDLVLMDIKMPRMNGLEATRKIREFRPDIPIIAQSAFNAQDDIQNAMDAGCNDYISKPFDKKVLLEKMRQNCRIGSLKL